MRRIQHILVAFVFLGLSLVVAMPAAAVSIAGANFANTWGYTDQPVAAGKVNRTWMWGPQADSPALLEPYAESPNGQRVVQYFDKARMEITHPDGDSSSVWYVTNGLLAEELITGRLQLGDNAFEQHAPAQVNVAGDASDANGPTYATFNKLMSYGAIPSGWEITQTVNRAGNVANDASLASYNVTAKDVGVPTHHNIASVFWDFMNSSGTVFQNGSYTSANLFTNPYYATGYPLTEAYWTNVLVGGVQKQVLVQVFERRVLTYTPTNPNGWKVEAGNVGQHYYTWRYQQLGKTPAPVSPQTTASATSVRVFEPFTAGGGLAPGVSVASTVSGSCWEGSLADYGRSDAWRCTGNGILDPCFSNPFGASNQVACASDPESQQVILLTLTQPLPDNFANTPAIPASDPWALELADGELCVMDTGATIVIGDMRANYGCSGGGVVFGDPNRSNSTWTVFYSPQGSSSLESIGVQVAWY